MKPLSFRQEFEAAGQFYIMAILYWISIGFMASYWVLYFLSLGLQYTQVSFLLLMYPIASIIFEIPTGAIADIFGRRKSVFLSYLLTGLSFTGVLLSGSNIFLLSIFLFLAGISFTMETGALEAWIVDTIKLKKKQKYLERLFGRRGSMGGIGFVIGAFLGGVLVNFGYDKAFWATAMGMLFLSMFVFLFTKEEYFKKKKTSLIKSIKNTIAAGKQGIKFTLNNKTVLMLTAVIFILTFTTSLVHHTFQPFVVDNGLEPQYIGYALSLAGLITIFTMNYAHKISEFLGTRKRTLMLFTVLYGFAVLGIAYIKYFPILFFCIVSIVITMDLAGSNSPAFRYLYNKFIPSKIRATVTSTSSFIWQIAYIFGVLGFGLFSQYFGLQYGLILAGIASMLSVLIYLLLKKS